MTLLIQVEVEAGRIAVLPVEGMPKWLDWCLLHRRERQMSQLASAFREFVLRDGNRIASCGAWVGA